MRLRNSISLLYLIFFSRLVAFAVVLAEHVPHRKLSYRETKGGEQDVGRRVVGVLLDDVEDQPPPSDGQLGDAVREDHVPLPRGVCDHGMIVHYMCFRGRRIKM